MQSARQIVRGEGRHRSARAFSLVELLVVLGIIAVLISLLMPMVGRVRHAARQAACLSNLRQLENGFMLYTLENNGQAMRYLEQPAQYWHHLIAPYLGDSRYASTADNGVHPNMSVLFCPEAPTLANGDDTGYTNQGVFGSANYAWHWVTGGAGGYGLNLWYLPDDPVYRAANNPPGYLTAGRYYPNLASAAPASDVPLMGDCNWVGSWPDSNDRVPPSLIIGDSAHAAGFFMGRFCIARHDKSINVVFADGSARNVRLADLWRLNWHQGWHATSVTIP